MEAVLPVQALGTGVATNEITRRNALLTNSIVARTKFAEKCLKSLCFPSHAFVFDNKILAHLRQHWPFWHE